MSTPVMTMPRVKNRCVSRNAMTGMAHSMAIANAVSDVNKPQLTAYYHAKTGIKKEQVFSSL